MHSHVAAAAGRIREHRRLVSEVKELGERRGLREFAAVELVHSALCEAEFGNNSEARQRAAAALALARGLASQVTAAIAIARTGDAAGADALLQEVATKDTARAPRGALLLGTAQASVALARDEPRKAVALWNRWKGSTLHLAVRWQCIRADWSNSRTLSLVKLPRRSANFRSTRVSSLRIWAHDRSSESCPRPRRSR